MQLDIDSPTWVAPVARWVAWDARPERTAAPAASELAFIDPLLRRRLSPLARMSLKVAHDCAGDLAAVRFVYASRHGELERTTAMLEDLAAGESVSPTAFSMSVLNASAGLFSIARKDAAPTTAVSAADESFGFGLLEACLQLASHPRAPVLLVFADEPVPDAYGEDDADCAHAVAVLLQTDAADAIAWLREPQATGAAGREPQSRAFLRCLAPGAGASRWQGETARWSWQRKAA